MQKGAETASGCRAGTRGKLSRCFNKRINDLRELILDGTQASCDQFLRIQLCSVSKDCNPSGFYE